MYLRMIGHNGAIYIYIYFYDDIKYESGQKVSNGSKGKMKRSQKIF